MTTAEQNRQELIDWLLAYAKKHEIVVEFVSPRRGAVLNWS